MTQIRNEIYDKNGLVEVVFTETNELTLEELILQKEIELLAIYEELQFLKKE